MKLKILSLFLLSAMLLSLLSCGGIDDVRVQDVYVKEEGSKKTLVIDAVKVLNKDALYLK